ncbi:MAG TPA: hypothetical protein VL625_04720 [Patescibacteria group bacterium]|jgi:hypothetical protein|nr:hypothetical protein [Patescibacteria group bacterium]
MSKYILRSATVGPDVIRGKLTSDFARSVFDKLNALGPRWDAEENSETGVIWAEPAISLYGVDGKFPTSVSGGLARTYNDAVTRFFDALDAMAKEPGAVALVMTPARETKAFFYDKKTKSFAPCDLPFNR